MSKVRGALTRKLGPLPVWAWALITGAVIFGYRTMKGQYSPGSSATVDAAASTDTTPQDVTTLDPGQSAYDPNTGALISTAPEQQAADGTGSGPITLAPGESIYDPTSGQLLTPPATPTAAPKKPSTQRIPKKPRPGRKVKPHHKPGAKVQPHTHGGKAKPHGHGTVKPTGGRTRSKPNHRGIGAAKHRPPSQEKGVRPARHHTAATQPTTHGRSPATHGSPRPRPASRPAPTRARATQPRTGALRQRPAATHPQASANSHAHPRATQKPAPTARKRRK